MTTAIPDEMNFLIDENGNSILEGIVPLDTLEDFANELISLQQMQEVLLLVQNINSELKLKESTQNNPEESISELYKRSN